MVSLLIPSSEWVCLIIMLICIVITDNMNKSLYSLGDIWQFWSEAFMLLQGEKYLHKIGSRWVFACLNRIFEPFTLHLWITKRELHHPFHGGL